MVTEKSYVIDSLQFIENLMKKRGWTPEATETMLLQLHIIERYENTPDSFINEALDLIAKQPINKGKAFIVEPSLALSKQNVKETRNQDVKPI